MARTFAPGAFWMTVSTTGVPRLHGTRSKAIEVGRKDKIPVYRQEAWTGRIDMVYYPSMDREYKPGERVVEKVT